MMQTSRSLFLLFYIFTVQELLFTTQEQLPKFDFSHSFHPQTLLIFVPFGNSIIPIIFQPFSHQTFTLIIIIATSNKEMKVNSNSKSLFKINDTLQETKILHTSTLQNSRKSFDQPVEMI